MKPFFISFCALAVLPLTANADQGRMVAGLQEVRIEPARRLHSKLFEWDQGIQIALPASYGKTNRSYPVLWVTDGPMYFELAVKTVNYDQRFHVPEMIIIAVGPPLDEINELGRRRTYEFMSTKKWGFTGFGSELLEKELAALKAAEPGLEGGGAAKFLTFLVDEARPALSREYRMTDDHMLFGDSGGGSFCVYTLFARPQAFARYICGSPSLYSGELELFRAEERYAREHQDLKAIVFFGAGEAEMMDPNPIISAAGVLSSAVRMVEILKSRKYPSLKLHARIFPGEDHASVVPLNLSWGLREVWQEQ